MAPKRKQSRVSYKATKSEVFAEIKSSFQSLDEEASAILASFRDSEPSNLPGREKHIDELNERIQDCLESEESFSIYISGSNGHGKTASIKLLCSKPYVKENFTIVYINCRQCRNDIYEEIISKLRPNLKPNPKSTNISRIKTLIKREKNPTLLILDEIDELPPRATSVLYSLFELRSEKSIKGKIALIAIGNKQNFIDKLPLVRDNDSIRPVLMEFGAYTKLDIKNIITGKLEVVAPERLIFSESAIELLAAKMASIGSARYALGFASAAVNHALRKAVGDDICKVNPDSVLAVINAGNTEDAINHLVLHEKLVLCSALVLLKRKICSPDKMKVQDVYEKFKIICTENCIDRISQTEFYSCCNRIEEQGIFVLKKKKKDLLKEANVIMKCNEDEIIQMMSSQILLGSIVKKY